MRALLDPLGVCPICGTEIPAERLVLRSETAVGWPVMAAACPACRELVHPQ